MPYLLARAQRGAKFASSSWSGACGARGMGSSLHQRDEAFGARGLSHRRDLALGRCTLSGPGPASRPPRCSSSSWCTAAAAAGLTAHDGPKPPLRRLVLGGPADVPDGAGRGVCPDRRRNGALENPPAGHFPEYGSLGPPAGEPAR